MMTAKNNLKGNVCYFQSGGPTAVINSSFKGLFDYYSSLKSATRIYVSKYGISGLIEGELWDVTFEDFSKLTNRPGSFSGSLRKKLTENDPAYEKIIETLKKYNIRYLFANGGNDSMDTCYKLSLLMKKTGYDCTVIGIPKTVDNDLLMTDHTPGFGSAAKYIANTVISIAVDDLSYKKGRINIIECMGRDSGYLTASASLASLRGVKPDFIYVPEVSFDLEKEVQKWEHVYDEKGRCLVVVSEGIHSSDGTLISAQQTTDSFGNIQMGGVCSFLANRVTKDGYKSRGIELSIPQRAGSMLLSKTDVKEALEVGKQALKKALDGMNDVMVTIERVLQDPYLVNYGQAPLSQVSGLAASLKKSFINKEGDNITDEFLDYCLPLISGEMNSMAEDGLLDI
ncbi:MAG: diphosphate--fructose-6-phosphate 1-phosphotransferase [Bacilli bacterium]